MSAAVVSWNVIRKIKFAKMMSAGAKSWQVVKSHIPLIKFRKGGKTRMQEPIQQKSSADVSQQASASPVGYSLRGTGIDESQLPQRYLRKPLSQVEMETIERGGPE